MSISGITAQLWTRQAVQAPAATPASEVKKLYTMSGANSAGRAAKTMTFGLRTESGAATRVNSGLTTPQFGKHVQAGQRLNVLA